MASSFTLTLDTTPPAITWGAPVGNAPGAVLVVPYDLTELAILSAQLQLPDTRVLDMAIGASALSVAIPAGAAPGTASLTVEVRDDVHNAAELTHSIEIVAEDFPIPKKFAITAPETSLTDGPRGDALA